MKKAMKQWMAIACALVMLACLLPVTILAEGDVATPTDLAPVEEPTQEIVPAEEPAEVPAEEPAAEPAEEPTEESAEEEPEIFREGYVFVKGGTVVYPGRAMKDEIGKFPGQAAAYAVNEFPDNPNSVWLKITFATEAGELKGYVRKEAVIIMTDDQVATLKAQLGTKKLPVVAFELTKTEEPAEPVEEPTEEIPVEEPTEEIPVEEPAEEPSEEPAAEEPAEEKPAAEEPVAAEEQGTENIEEYPTALGTDETVEAEPEVPAEEPAAELTEEEPTEEVPAAEEPAAEEPAAEEPAEEPVEEEIPAEGPVEEPAEEPAEKPAEKKPENKAKNEPKVIRDTEEPKTIDDYGTPLDEIETVTLETVTEAGVRLDPDGLSALFLKLEEGTEVTVLEQKDDWYVVLIGDKIGYVYVDDLTTLQAEEPEQPAQPEEKKETPKKVTIFSSRTALMTEGETVYLTSKLEGFEDAEEILYVWKVNKGNGFEEIPGANEATYSFAATEETLTWSWHLTVLYY